MIRIEVFTTEVREISGKAKATGNPYKIRKQEAYLHTLHRYPDRFELSLKDEAAPYKPGFYTLTPASIVVNGEFKQLELSRYEMELLRLPESDQGEYAVKPAATKAA